MCFHGSIATYIRAARACVGSTQWPCMHARARARTLASSKVTSKLASSLRYIGYSRDDVTSLRGTRRSILHVTYHTQTTRVNDTKKRDRGPMFFHSKKICIDTERPRSREAVSISVAGIPSGAPYIYALRSRETYLIRREKESKKSNNSYEIIHVQTVHFP